MSLWRMVSPHDGSTPLVWPSLRREVLLERDFYSRFFNDDKWLGSLPVDGPQRKFVVLGHPGIGKSAFGVWLIAQLLRGGRTVVYSHNSAKIGSTPDTKHFVFHRGVALRTTLPYVDAAMHLLSDPSVVHICDSCKPTLDDPCHQIMLTSPDPDMWRWFVEKEFARSVYFPVYTDAELEALRAAEYGDALPASIMALRVKAWGPVPRQVFSDQQAAVRDGILRSLSNANLAILQRAKNDVEASMARRPSDHSPHSLFLLNADRATLMTGSVSFRSCAVGRRVLRTLAAHQYDALIRGIQQLLESRSTKTVAGTVFEIAVMDSLEHGGSFACRRLDDVATASSASLSPSTAMKAKTSTTTALLPAPVLTLRKANRTVPFDSLALIEKASGVWPLDTHRFVPDSPNFASIDSIEVGLRLVQITTKRTSHELKVTSGRSEKEGLAAIAKKLLPLMGSTRWGGDNAYLEVYFVVTEGHGASFGPQKLEFFDFSQKLGKTMAPGDTVCPVMPVSKPMTSGEPGPHAEPVQGFPSSFRILHRGKPVTVEVRQFVLEMPLSVLRASDDAAPPRDAIDEAGET